MSSLFCQVINGDATKLRNFFGTLQSLQTFKRCTNNVDWRVGAQTLGSNVGNAGQFHNVTNRTTGSNPGTFNGWLEHDLATTVSTDNFVRNGRTNDWNFNQVLLSSS